MSGGIPEHVEVCNSFSLTAARRSMCGGVRIVLCLLEGGGVIGEELWFGLNDDRLPVEWYRLGVA